MELIVDRIEENTAVVETESGEMLSIPAVLLSNIKEGERFRLTVEKIDDKERLDTHSIFEELRNKSKKVE